MKLTTQQISTIKRYLDSQHLSFQEFYDEMLDHLILETEARMTDSGLVFETTFWGIIEELDKQYKKPFDMFLSGGSLKGIKVLDRQSFATKYKEKQLEFWNRFLKKLSSPYWVVALFVTLIVSSWNDQIIDFKVPLHYNEGGLVFGIMGGITLTLLLQLFQRIPLTDLFLRQGLLGWLIRQDQIDKLRSNEEHSAWKFTIFAFGLIVFTMLVLMMYNLPISLTTISLLLFFEMLALVISVQLLLEEKRKLKGV